MNTGYFAIENGVLTAYRGDAEIVIVPDSVTRIAARAFYGKHLMQKVILSNSVTHIDAYAFDHCVSLLTIRISGSVRHIEPPMTNCCGSIQRILVDEENTAYCNIGSVLCSADKKSLIRAPEGLDAIAYSIPDGIEQIGSYAFFGCHLLQCTDVPDSVRQIGDKAFAHCTSMRQLFLPGQLTIVAEDAFLGCAAQRFFKSA